MARTELHPIARFVDAITSLKLTIVCLGVLMVLVVACTLAQVRLGTFGAVDEYIRAFVVWWDLPGSEYSIPIFPGGATVGLVLGVNLVAAQVRRLELSSKKAGIWIVHAGLVLLFVGEFVTGVYQLDSRMAIEEGQTRNYVERYREHELAVVDVTDPAHDDVYGIPESLLAAGGTVTIPGTPLAVRVRDYFRNADLRQLQPGEPSSGATAGVGPQLVVRPAPPVSADDQVNLTTALVEPIAGGQGQGVWLVSTALSARQAFTWQGRTYELWLRPQREYLGYSLTLKDFKHDVYAGTEIPKNFSSLVRLDHPEKRESRDVLIYMNQPLRYGGKAFYQASFGKGDTLSIFQVVENPGWLLPYVSCVLVTIGLVVHFAMSLRRSARRRAQQQEPRGAAVEVA